MNLPLIAVMASQLLFTVGDLLARQHIKGDFTLSNLLSGWIVVYLLLRTAGTFLQLYVLSAVELGKTMALFGAASILVANVLGWLVLREVLPPITYVGVGLAVVAIAAMSWR